jgi:hypothetical protein
MGLLILHDKNCSQASAGNDLPDLKIGIRKTEELFLAKSNHGINA